MIILTRFFIAITLIALLFSSSSTTTEVNAMFKVPDLAPERRCPACVSFAAALRRASWESHPPHSAKDRSDRKRHLNFDNRCQEVLTEAMDVVLTRQAFAYFSPEDLPLVNKWRLGGGSQQQQQKYNKENGEVVITMPNSKNNHNNKKDDIPFEFVASPQEANSNDLIILYFNKSDAPKNAIGRFWSLQDLYLHRRLQLSDFQKIMTTLSKNADQSLMHFMHDEIRESLGDESEGLCYLDLFHSKNFTREEYINLPIGAKNANHFTRVGKAFDLNAPWLTLNILKNRSVDEAETLPWAYKLCKSKDMCGKDAANAPGFGSKKVREYIATMFPVHPPKMSPKDFSEDPEKATGEFVVDDKHRQAAMKGHKEENDNTIEYSGDEKPLFNEDF